jgi:hypothetical protein
MSLINVKIRNTKGHTTTIEMRSNQTIGELKSIYTTRINENMSNLQIRFDGEILNNNCDNKTLDEYGIGNNDVLTSNDRSLGG